MTTPDQAKNEISLLYIPCGSEDEAASLASRLLEERLVACGNIYRSRSIYRWEGRAQDETEHVLLCKTAPSRVEAARRRALELHSYTVPCVLIFETVEANPAYAHWVHGEVTGKRADTQSGEANQGE